MNVVRYRDKVGRLLRVDQERFIAPCKEVSAQAMPTVVARRVGGLEPMHPAHQISFRSLHQQVIMIAQQDVGVDAPAVAPTSLAQGFKKDFPVPRIPENRLPPIAAAEKMIKRSIEFYPRHSGHQMTIGLPGSDDKNKDMTPISPISSPNFYCSQPPAHGLNSFAKPICPALGSRIGCAGVPG